jgi:hypothetical protein
MGESAETVQAKYQEESRAHWAVRDSSNGQEHNLSLEYADMTSNAFGSSPSIHLMWRAEPAGGTDG